MTTSSVSYGTLARQVGYGEPAKDGQSTISWLENGELQHLAEPRWYAFLLAFNLHTATMPGTIVPKAIAETIVEAAELDPGAEKPWTFQDDLDELTSAAMTRMVAEATQSLTAVLGKTHTAEAINGYVDAILGRCSPLVRRVALDAYNLHR